MWEERWAQLMVQGAHVSHSDTSQLHGKSQGSSLSGLESVTMKEVLINKQKIKPMHLKEKLKLLLTFLTRMHSSRMCTVRCSSRLLWGVCPGGVCLPGRVSAGPSRRGGLPGGDLPRGCLSRGGVCLGGVCLPRGCLPGGEGICSGVYTSPPPVDRIPDTCLWKHYLSATSFADGNDSCDTTDNQIHFGEGERTRPNPQILQLK